MISIPYFRLFAWIGVAIAISFTAFHLLAPDSPQFVESEVRFGAYHSPASHSAGTPRR